MRTRFPEWIRRVWGSGEDFSATKTILDDLGLHTVCESARCPNIGECWRHRTATMMVLGNVCTRNCAFCSVRSGAPEPVDPDEPGRVAEAVRRLNLAHAVITSVTRDDLADGGASHVAQCVAAIRGSSPDTTVEVLVPDFQGDRGAMLAVLAAGPEVFGHNIETVARLYPDLRDSRYDYARSLAVLDAAAGAQSGVLVKSALMVGHGETEAEVRETLEHLRDAGCEVVCIGQYLRPTRQQREVVEFVEPERFKAYERLAYALGFGFVAAGPFVRSSYRSAEAVRALRECTGAPSAVQGA